MIPNQKGNLVRIPDKTEDCATYFFKEGRWATGQRRALSLSLRLQGESDVGVHDRVIVLTAHKLNIKADVEMRGRAQMAEEEEDPTG